MGMGAQAGALSAISENIANSGTVGYKSVTTQFETLLNGVQGSGDAGGGVRTRNRYVVDAQGALQDTGSTTDIAVKGAGFFVVSNSAGQTFLTRAGSFTPDALGRLVNSAGFYLKGIPANGGASGSSSDLASMEVIRIQSDKLLANPTTSGVLSANLPSGAAVVAAANLPSTNSAAAAYTAKTSLTAYDNLGNPVVMDIYFSKTAANAWEMSAYNANDAAAGGGFPYTSAALVTQALAFDPTNGNISAGSPAAIPIPNGGTMTLDLGNTTQLAAAFTVNSANADGSAPSAVSQIEIGSDGSLNYIFGNGKSQTAYQIALARVNSPDNLTNISGNAYAANSGSGQIFVGAAGTSGFGDIASSSLESSTVDLAGQLSSLIVAQRSFTANSQVFQVDSDVLQVLNNLK
jgi:flagellar hook protein FlgE